MENNEKIDKDLEVFSEMKFNCLWEEQPNSDIKFSVRYQRDQLTTLVMAQAMASIMDEVLAEDKQRVKGKRMKIAERQRHVNARDLMAGIAARLGKLVYDEQIQLPDNRIKLLDKDGN